MNAKAYNRPILEKPMEATMIGPSLNSWAYHFVKKIIKVLEQNKKLPTNYVINKSPGILEINFLPLTSIYI